MRCFDVVDHAPVVVLQHQHPHVHSLHMGMLMLNADSTSLGLMLKPNDVLSDKPVDVSTQFSLAQHSMPKPLPGTMCPM